MLVTLMIRSLQVGAVWGFDISRVVEEQTQSAAARLREKVKALTLSGQSGWPSAGMVMPRSLPKSPPGRPAAGVDVQTTQGPA